MEEEIYYLCATLLTGGGATVYANRNRADAIGHFYIKAGDGSGAGAIASDICRAKDIKFVDYLCLPAMIRKDQLVQSEEHRMAYDVAMKSGVALVLSVVIGEDLAPIDIGSLAV